MEIKIKTKEDELRILENLMYLAREKIAFLEDLHHKLQTQKIVLLGEDKSEFIFTKDKLENLYNNII